MYAMPCNLLSARMEHTNKLQTILHAWNVREFRFTFANKTDVLSLPFFHLSSL